MSDTIKDIDSLAQQLFVLKIEQKRIQANYDTEIAKLKREYAPLLEQLDQQIDIVGQELRDVVTEHKSELVATGRQSFATLQAIFQFRKATSKLRVKNPGEALKVARQLGVVRKVANMKVKWVLDSAKFFSWLKRNDEYREIFDDYLEYPSDSESITLRPNSTYTVVHDGKRISPPSVTLPKSQPR